MSDSMRPVTLSGVCLDLCSGRLGFIGRGRPFRQTGAMLCELCGCPQPVLVALFWVVLGM